MVPAGSPELTGSFHLAPSAAAGWTLFAFQLLGVLLEPPLLAMAQGGRARTLRTVGLSLMAAALLAAAAAPSYAVLLAALLVYGPASGLGTQLAQATLLGSSTRAEVTLARWELLSQAGDLLAPAVLAGSVALGLGWRGALASAALVAALQALAVARAPAGDGLSGVPTQGDGGGSEDEPAPAPLREAVRAALAAPRLLAWSLAVALCGLLDEILVSFGALWLSARGMDAPARAAVFAAWVGGGMVGSLVLERAAARVAPAALLLVAGAGSAAAYVAWLGTATPLASAGLAALAGAFTSTHYPLLRARAFAALPGRPHVVLAVGAAFTAVDLAAPVLVGAVADRLGLLAAMLVLLAQPAAVVTAAWAARRTPPRGDRP